MKKILFFIHDLGVGGAEKVLVNLANNLDITKFNITVLTLFGGGVNEQFLNDNITYRSCFKKVFPANSHVFKLFSPTFLYQRFIKEDYDIIVSYLEGPTARIVSGCRNKRTKLISWIHSKMDNRRTASIGFRSFSEAKKCYNKFDFTACVSKWVLDYFVDTFEFKKAIDVIYNTIETEEIAKKANEPIKDVILDNQYVNICSVGKVSAVKGFDRFARIHKRLIDNGIKNHVYILGIGEDKEKIQAYLKENNLENTFSFLGYSTNPYKYVKACDLYVCSSLSEGFSTSVTEALIVGTPVVTTLCSGMKELLGENNEYGIVTDNQEDALYNGIKKMISTPGLLEEYAKRAKERGKFFNKEKTVKAVEVMFEKL